MARIRTIKPEFWNDEKLGPLPALVRLVFLGLIGMADDLGRLTGNLKQIDAFIFPYTDETARDALGDLERIGRIERGATKNGQAIIQIVNWHHQRIDKPNLNSCLPPIEQDSEGFDDTSKTDPGTFVETSTPGSWDHGIGDHGTMGSGTMDPGDLMPPAGAAPATPPRESEKTRRIPRKATKIQADDHPGFDVFWDAYPRRCPRRDKGDARKMWQRHKPDLQTVLDALAWQDTDYPDWQKEGGAFIEAPAVWLNKHRWERERPGIIPMVRSDRPERGTIHDVNTFIDVLKARGL